MSEEVGPNAFLFDDAEEVLCLDELYCYLLALGLHMLIEDHL